MGKERIRLRSPVSPSLPLIAALVAVLFATLVGCAIPVPVVRLQPNAENVVWVSGRAVVGKEQTGVRVATAFEHQDGDTVALRVEIHNGTEQPLEIDSKQVSYIWCATAPTGSCSTPSRVIDPERMLHALDVKRSSEKAEATNSQALLGSLLLLSVVGDVASVANRGTDHATGLHSLALSNQMDHSAARHDSSLSTIAAQRDLWSNAALRRNTIAPGNGVGGLVFIPIDADARHVWLQIQLGGRYFPFSFRKMGTRTR
jgi:hypothetical protein